MYHAGNGVIKAFAARGVKRLERATGFEPATYSLGSCHSTTELRPLCTSRREKFLSIPQIGAGAVRPGRSGIRLLDIIPVIKAIEPEFLPVYPAIAIAEGLGNETVGIVFNRTGGGINEFPPLYTVTVA